MQISVCLCHYKKIMPMQLIEHKKWWNDLLNYGVYSKHNMSQPLGYVSANERIDQWPRSSVISPLVVVDKMANNIDESVVLDGANPVLCVASRQAPWYYSDHWYPRSETSIYRVLGARNFLNVTFTILSSDYPIDKDDFWWKKLV